MDGQTDTHRQRYRHTDRHKWTHILRETDTIDAQTHMNYSSNLTSPNSDPAPERTEQLFYIADLIYSAGE